MKILIIVTSHAQLGSSGKPTGLWLEEVAIPYRVFTAAGAEVDLASPAGGPAPVDPKSEDSADPEVQAFRADPEARRALAGTRPLDQVRAAAYDAVFVAGGHGVMWDLASSASAAALISDAYRSGGVVAAVCHGPAALVAARQPDGTALVAGKRLTAFSDDEERAVGLAEVVPFLLQARLEALGARFEGGPLWQSRVVRDGRLITGGNPASSRAAAQETLAALAEVRAS